MATNSNRWQPPPNARPPSGSGSGSSSSSHHRDDAQFIEFTPLPTSTARTPVALEDSRLLESNPIPPSDHSQFQLARQQALLSQAATQQQLPTCTGSAASFAPSPLNPTGVGADAPPSSFLSSSNNPFSRTFNPPLSSLSPSRPPSQGSSRPYLRPHFFSVPLRLSVQPTLWWMSTSTVSLGAQNASGVGRFSSQSLIPSTMGRLFRMFEDDSSRHNFTIPVDPKTSQWTRRICDLLYDP